MVIRQLKAAGQLQIVQRLHAYWKRQDLYHLQDLLQIEGVYPHDPHAKFLW